MRHPERRRAGGLLLLCALVALPAAAREIAPERQAALVHLLRHDCGSCHGMTLQGGLGPPLTRPALQGKPAPALEATIKFGRPGTPMPPWQGLLSDAEVRWLVQGLKTGALQ